MPDPTASPPPKIIHNTDRDARFVDVTYSLPGLRRATLAVRRARWVEGGHSALGRHLTQLLAELDLQSARHESSLPG